MINNEIKNFYLKTSIYTYYGEYKKYFISLPEDKIELSKLIATQVIHRTKLFRSYTNTVRKFEDEKYILAIKEEYPWQNYRLHDDILLTANSITAELFRLDNSGFTENRKIENKVVITCRYVACLLASILKAKNIPTRVRSGFAPYITSEKSVDHWICQYYSEKEERWISIDANDNYKLDFNQWDIPKDKFYYAPQVWLDARKKQIDINKYVHGTHKTGLKMLAETLFYDFFSIMNEEISYLFIPVFISNDEKFKNLTDKDLLELDYLAELMLDIDKNFNELKLLFENNKKYRPINTPLLSDQDHLEINM